MIRVPPRSTLDRSSAASDVYKRQELGVAWRKTSQTSGESYLRVKLDDPALPQPIWGALMEATQDGVVRLVWSRQKATDT